jgi:hypothetical protein
MQLTHCNSKTKQHKYQKVMCHIQTDIPAVIPKQNREILEYDVLYSNKHATCHLWFQQKTKKKHQKVMHYIQIGIQLTHCDSKTKQKEISESNVYIQIDMQFTSCYFKTKQEEISERDVPYLNRHVTYSL